jgi:hypothetical protein
METVLENWSDEYTRSWWLIGMSGADNDPGAWLAHVSDAQPSVAAASAVPKTEVNFI